MHKSKPFNIILIMGIFLALTAGGVFLLIKPTPSTSGNKKILVYCATVARQPMEEIARRYRQETGVTVEVQYNGSGMLLSNIQLSGKGDVYIPADEQYAEEAARKGLAIEQFPLAATYPVMVVKKGNPLGVKTLQDLMRPDVRVSMADPRSASIGTVLKAILEKTGQWSSLEKKVTVIKPTVTDVANDVKLGTVDAGIIWNVMEKQYQDLEMLEDPLLKARTYHITAVVLKTSGDMTEARKFTRYLTDPSKGQVIFREFGYPPAVK